MQNDSKVYTDRLKELLVSLLDLKINAKEANKIIASEYFEELYKLPRKDSVLGKKFDDNNHKLYEFSVKLKVIFLTNKIVEIIRNEKSYDPIISEECIRKSYTTLLEYYKDPTNPYSRPVDWVHGIDPELSKHYRNLVNHPSSLKS